MAVAFLGCTYNFNCLALNRYQAVLPDFRQSKGLSFLVDSRFNRSKQRTSMEMQGNGVPMTIDHSAVKIPHVLTVAGSYSGAGIQADLKTCAALGVYCSTVIIAVTAQNTVGVQVVNIVPEEFVAEQMKSVLSDTDVDVEGSPNLKPRGKPRSSISRRNDGHPLMQRLVALQKK